jgi:methanogenic corrinoid protein MtbC1
MALEAGNEARSRQVLLNLYLAGHPTVDISDRVIAPAFHALGSAWQHGTIEVYQERRACEICVAVLHELKGMLPSPATDAPYAIGGTLADDPYALPNTMVELVLREAGWRAESHGTCNPAATLAAAIRERRPGLFWLSVSTMDSENQWLSEYGIVSQAAAEEKVPIAVGGRAVTPELRHKMTYAAYCDSLRHLVGFAEAIKR